MRVEINYYGRVLISRLCRRATLSLSSLQNIHPYFGAMYSKALYSIPVACFSFDNSTQTNRALCCRFVFPLPFPQMVLSACSPYFQVLFTNTPDDKHPILILKDITLADMKSLLDFMYRGEVSVDQERLTAFLRVAESLRIKGLTEVSDDKPAAAPVAATTQTPAAASNSNNNNGGTASNNNSCTAAVQQHQQKQPQQQQQREQTAAANLNNNGGSQQQLQQPPQLHRINQPYAQQQQQQRKVGGGAGAGLMMATNPLLGSALTQPKRKRGRPRKLSGSSTDGRGAAANGGGDASVSSFDGAEQLVQVRQSHVTDARI